MISIYKKWENGQKVMLMHTKKQCSFIKFLQNIQSIGRNLLII